VAQLGAAGGIDIASLVGQVHAGPGIEAGCQCAVVRVEKRPVQVVKVVH
jgi:hypothetical protein